ncbi:MAG: Gfo/Idh/MocA family oxidoreductase [Planctomycetes bacterium]|nr:Gfo/Idh/MocA family oxidoreductase [Planctomycetota bacterium]
MAKFVILGVAHPHIHQMTQCAKKVAGGEVLGVWDDDAARRAEAAKKMSLPEIATLDAALAMKPDVIVSAAVPTIRVDIAERALAAGAAAFIDKPLALSREALARLEKAVETHKKPVVTYYPYRGYPQMLAAKKALDAGRIGKLVRVLGCGPHKLNAPTRPAWHWTRAGNGGALLDIGSHFADLLCWFTGQTPATITAMHGNFDQPSHREFQDFGTATLRFPSGALGTIEVDWLNPASMKNFGDSRLWLQGSKGKIELRLGDVTTAEIWTHETAQQPLDVAGYEDIDTWTTRQLAELAAGRIGDVPQADIWRASRVTLAAFDSASAGGRVVEMI